MLEPDCTNHQVKEQDTQQNLDRIKWPLILALGKRPQLPQVKLGNDVKVLIDNGDKEMQTFTGKVSWISSEAEFTPKIIQTKEERVKLMYAVKVVVANNGVLKIGMPGEVVF